MHPLSARLGNKGEKPRTAPVGDEAVLVEFGRTIDRDTHRRVQALVSTLAARADADWLRGVVPAYSSVLVHYDPERVDYAKLEGMLLTCAVEIGCGAASAFGTGRLVEIPVHYGGEHGPDLEWVAEHVGMTQQEVIESHSAPTYVVYMLGFSPGFCYLGDLPAELSVPRRRTPRLGLPAGAVAIGGRQTGIYSLDGSPGGWRWIGRTPLKLWDPDRNPPFLLKAGDRVRFVPI